MKRTLIYLRKEELDALREAAERTGRSVADLVREAVRRMVLKSPATGPIAIWDGKAKRPSLDHDNIYDTL
jgi:predicted transcriptional regulator